MRTVGLLALAALSLTASGCGNSCGDVPPVVNGYAAIQMHVAPESAVTPPETVVISSPIHASNEVPAVAGDAGVWTQFPVYGSSPGLIGTPAGFISKEASGDRLLSIGWYFVDGDANSPPSDQFDVTVTDAAGTVTGRFEQTGHYTWTPRMTCAQSGHWNGPELKDDAGTD
jgi:hypothetical protein